MWVEKQRERVRRASEFRLLGRVVKHSIAEREDQGSKSAVFEVYFLSDMYKEEGKMRAC